LGHSKGTSCRTPLAKILDPPLASRGNRLTTCCVQEIEMLVDEERRAGGEARQAAAILERKRATLSAEMEDVRALLETVRGIRWR